MLLKTAFLLITTGASVFFPALSSVPLDRPFSASIAVRDESSGFTNVAALNPFFQQLAAFESHSRLRPIRIMQYGDSHTKADLFTGAVRKRLQRDFDGDGSRLVKTTSYSPSSNDGRMVVYQPLGINGARAKRLSEMSESPGFLQGVSQSRPDLIVIAYGTNEVTDLDWTVDSYSRMLSGIIARLRSADPDASILIIGPPDRSVAGAGGWTSARRMPSLLEAQKRAAFLAGAAFWSECDAMGGAGSMNTWVARGLGRLDHVHFTANGYDRLAGLFYSDLINAYRSGRVGTPASRKGLDLREMQGVPVTSKKSN
jgi:lysophospholipase L1-like esterase